MHDRHQNISHQIITVSPTYRINTAFFVFCKTISSLWGHVASFVILAPVELSRA